MYTFYKKKKLFYQSSPHFILQAFLLLITRLLYPVLHSLSMLHTRRRPIPQEREEGDLPAVDK